ncbi:hypothetical protein M758_11G033300 [Ceratodon purpureus]|nr:hypothetical protein M758_11G033300 [Ceratodon purpureus]
MWRWWMWRWWILQCLSFPWRWWSSLPPDPPDGIKKISDSVYVLREPTEPLEIEIVFIHGLQLSDYSEAFWRTWVVEKKDKDGRRICWPKEWLGDAFPGARILSLKYDSCIRKTNATGRMDGYLLGESLVQEMVEMANIGQKKNCPVVFVCHSVGGLVAKEIVIKAYRKYGNNSKYVNFLQSIRGFHFYATPHDGSKLADLAAYLPFMGGMVNLVEVINKELGRLNEEFARIQRDDYANRWQFSVVAETHITSCYGFSAMVVEEASARHEYNTFLSVGTDHFGICKPGDKTSSSYLALKNFIELIQQDNKLRKDNLLDFPPFVVGMDSRVKEVCDRLKDHCVIGLVGMGGVGKTTLSKHVFNAEKDKFDRYCFLEDVKSRGNIETCQRRLLRDLCGEQWDETVGVNYQLGKIKECIISKKVLLVIDDAGDEADLRSLQVAAFNDGKTGSKVIVTTRRRDIFENPEDIMDVDFLSNIQAMALFSYYAFNGVEDSVRVQFDSQAKDIVEACGNLPLSLEVIGQFLRSKWKDKSCESIEKKMRVWKEALRRLKEAESLDGSSKDEKLWKRLMISYDDLSSNEKSMFLDMACVLLKCEPFYSVGEKFQMLRRDTVERIWNSELLGIQNLTNRSLIKWSGDDNMLDIHDQLQDMVRRIALNEVDGNKSHVWDMDEGLQTLVQKKGLPKLEGIVFAGFDKTYSEHTRLNTDEVDNFSGLRLLCMVRCENRLVEYFMRCSPNKLKWFAVNDSDVTVSSIEGVIHLKSLNVLYFRECNSLESLPTSIGNLSLLTELDLSYCTRLKSLPNSIGGLSLITELNLTCCKGLKSLPEGIGGLHKLQVLKLWGCESLESLPTSIGSLSMITKLNLTRCKGLKSLPESIGGLHKLQVLKLHECESLESLPTSIGSLSMITELDLSHCKGLKSLPESIGGLHKLQVLKLHVCESLESLPTSIGSLSMITELDLSYCRGLKSLPEGIGGLHKLKVLKLWGCESLESLPTSIGSLSMITELNLTRCKGLKSLPESIGGLHKLQVLKLHECESLESLPTSIGSLSMITELNLTRCKGLKSLPESIGGLHKLQVLKLHKCESLESLPTSIGSLSMITELDLSYCRGLKSLPESIGGLHKLQVLKLHVCESLESLPTSIGSLSMITKLDLSYCRGLKSLPESIGGLHKLQVLELCGCKSLESLPTSIGSLSMIIELNLSSCRGLKSLPESIGGLHKLKVLKLWGCESLESLPTSIGSLSMIIELDLSHCRGLKSLPEGIGGLHKLKVLMLWGCESLESLPTSIGSLSMTTKLNLSYCKGLKSLPESIGGLHKLQVLKLHECESLESLPTSIGSLSMITKLNLTRCKGLKSLPESIGGLHKLEVLKLCGCESLESLPTSIGSLSMITELDLSHCKGLKSLPESIGGLHKLEVLKLWGCESLESLRTSIDNLSPPSKWIFLKAFANIEPWKRSLSSA